MKRQFFFAVITASLLTSGVQAQRGTFMHGGFGAHPPGNVVVPPLGNVVPPLGASNPGVRGRFGGPGKFPGGNFFDVPLFGVPWYDGDYAGYNDGGYYQSAPSVIVLMPQFQMPEPPAPPPPPIRPETREYNWPSAQSSNSAAAFSIVSKDRREQPAVAVWAQDHFLCYVAPNGSTGRIPIDSIDREATIQRNSEKNLKLPLPPAS